MLVSPMLRGARNIRGFILVGKFLPTRLGNCSNTACEHFFRCEDNNAYLMREQPHFYRTRQVEHHYLRRSTYALYLSIYALGAIPK